MDKQRLLVIGNGMAGARTVEEILQRGGGDQFHITMLGDEPYGNYNRILLSNVLNGSQEISDIFLNPLEWYKTNGIELKAGVRAEKIDRDAKTVSATDGSVFGYDKLIIATGSRAFVPPMQGIEGVEGRPKAGFFVFRTIDDCQKIASFATKSRKAVVLGGGLLGLEAARGLVQFGVEIHVVHLGPYLMENQLDSTAAGQLRRTMEGMGIHIHLGKSTTGILGGESIEGVTFKDGEKLDCDMLVVSCGIRPNAEIAKECGLPVERAIVVDDHMLTAGDPDIYAVGECAQHRGKVYGLVAPLWEQGRYLADHITGKNKHSGYAGSKIATKLKVMGVELASIGINEPADERDEVVVFSEPKRGVYKKLIIRNDKLVGAILLGDVSKAAPLLQAFDRDSTLPDDRTSLLFDIGAPSTSGTMIEMPESTQVCNCNGVSKGQIRACVESGKRNLKAVMTATRAGTGCGSCKLLVKEIVEWACDGQTEDDPSIHYYVPGIQMAKPELIDAIERLRLKSVSSVFEALAGGKEDAGSKTGLASLLKTIWGAEYIDERDARYINDRVHANIQKDKTFSVIPRMYGGVTSADDLRKIADVADKFHVPMIKVTGGQRIDLLGVKKDDLPGVWRDLGMPSGHAYSKAFRTCKTCVGTEFCRYEVGDSTGLGIKIEHRFQGLEAPGKIKMATAGCPRNCSEALVKDVGIVAIEGGKWELHIGGAAGSHIRKGDLLCTVDSHDQAILLTGRFLQYYRENAKYLERTYGFVERIGIAKIREVVVDDREGIAKRLDDAMQASVDAYKDPWLERDVERTANQFVSVLPVLEPVALAEAAR